MNTTVFPLIADPNSYDPSTIDLVHDIDGRRIWLDIFESHLSGLMKLAAQSRGDTSDARDSAAEFGRQFGAILSDFRRDPMVQGAASVLRFCTLREELLRRHGFDDPYRSIKHAENEAALVLLPELLAEIDATQPERRVTVLVENIFAGNLFDLGCAGTIAMYESGEAEFRAARRRLPPRPWSIDDLDALVTRLSRTPGYRKAIVFVDNAGGDIVLGMIPFARYLLQSGTVVVLTANTTPALNDITAPELDELLSRVAALDRVVGDALRDGRLRCIPSGNGVPLIDLSRVSPQLAAAAGDADLLVLEGMGRSLETNFHARFTVDTLKVAMVKEAHVAKTVGGKLYEPVCRFEVAGTPRRPESAACQSDPSPARPRP